MLEFCTSIIIFQSKTEGSERKEARTSNGARNYLLKTFFYKVINRGHT